MPRRRNARDRDLPKYLYIRKGNFYIVNPQNLDWYALKTKDRELALERYNSVMQAWGVMRVDHAFKVIEGRGRTLRVLLEECILNIDVMKTSNNLRPLADNTRLLYLGCARALLSSENAVLDKAFPIVPTDIRQILSPWMETAGRRNNIRSLLVRILDNEVDAGRLETNPARDVRRKPGLVRDTYLLDEHFWIIHDALPSDVHRDIMILMYLLSQRPVDIFKLRYEDAVKAMKDPVVIDGEVHYTLEFTQQKTRTSMAIDFHENDQIAAIFRRGIERYKKFKPSYKELFFHLQLRRPIVDHMFGRAFRAAVRKNNLPPYQVRDLRSKGLTDEELQTGNSVNRVNKGGHKNRAVSDSYVKIKPPVRSRNNLSIERFKQEEGGVA